MPDEIFSGGVSNIPAPNADFNPKWREQLTGTELNRASERQRAEDSNAHELAKRAAQAKFAAPLARFYAVRNRWRAICATTREISDRYRAARAELNTLEDRHPARVKGFSDAHLPIPLSEVHAIEQRRELVAVLKRELDESDARASLTGQLVSNLLNYLREASAEVLEDR